MYIIIRAGDRSNPCILKICYFIFYSIFSECFTHFIDQDIVWSSNWLPKNVNMDQQINAQKPLLPTSELYRYKNNKWYKQFLLQLIRNRYDSFIKPD